MKEVYLEVTKSLPDDFGRGIARIDPAALPELRLSPGDAIEIAGTRTTVATAIGAEDKSVETGHIRIDWFTRQNAGVDMGDRVNVRKAQVRPAEYISFAPIEGAAIPLNDDIIDDIRAQLTSRPIMKGDAMPLMSSMDTLLNGKQPGLATTLVAVGTNPPGPVAITDQTEIDIRYKPVKLPDKEEPLETYRGLRKDARKLRDLIDLHLKQPELFRHVGIKPSHGIVLYGASGTVGKLLVESAIAGSGYHVFSVSGLDLISKYYGQSEEKLKGVFAEAVGHMPSVILVEHMGAIAPRRKHEMSDAERKLLASFITLLDDLNGRVVVIGLAANAYDIEPSLRAAGRFEMEIELKALDIDGRLDMLRMYTRGMPLGDVSLERIAKDSAALPEHELEAVVKKAALNALLRSVSRGSIDQPLPYSDTGRILVKAEDFDAALEDAFMRKSEAHKQPAEPPRHSKGFDVDRQRYSETITEVPK